MRDGCPTAATTRALLVALTLAATGCGFPLGPCEQERIEVRGTTAVQRAGQSSTDDVFGAFAPGNNPEHYPAVKRFLIDAPPRAGEAVVWSVPAFRVNGGYIAVLLSGPLRAGDQVPVVGAFEGGGWGTSTASREASATVSVRADDFVASSASGTIEVLGVAPLRLRLDVTAGSAAGAAMRIRGEVRFSLLRENVPCT
jgi:hypothetical protein